MAVFLVLKGTSKNPLSLWERVRVRAVMHELTTPILAFSRREKEFPIFRGALK
jgi:hypothetical protein